MFTLVEIKSACKLKHVFTIWPRNPNQHKLSDVLHCIINQLKEIQDMSALNWAFWDLRVLVRKLANVFGHPTQVSMQVQLVSTWNYLQVHLTRAERCLSFFSSLVEWYPLSCLLYIHTCTCMAVL